jgi:hypothetical protein
MLTCRGTFLSIQIPDDESEGSTTWNYFEEIISNPLATNKKPVSAENLDRSRFYSGLKLEEKK